MADYRNDDNPPANELGTPAACDDAASGGVPASDAGIARRLRELAEDITAFIALQNSRLEWAARASVAGEISPCDCGRRQSELESRKRELEERHREAVRQVEDEYEKLTAVWDRLEDEQRRLLARGNHTQIPGISENPRGLSAAGQTAQRESGDLSSPARPGAAVPAGDVDLIGDVAAPAGGHVAEVGPADVDPWSREPAARQFQQLKREIRRHARRRKA